MKHPNSSRLWRSCWSKGKLEEEIFRLSDEQQERGKAKQALSISIYSGQRVERRRVQSIPMEYWLVRRTSQTDGSDCSERPHLPGHEGWKGAVQQNYGLKKEIRMDTRKKVKNVHLPDFRAAVRDRHKVSIVDTSTPSRISQQPAAANVAVLVEW